MASRIMVAILKLQELSWSPVMAHMPQNGSDSGSKLYENENPDQGAYVHASININNTQINPINICGPVAQPGRK